MIIDEFKSISIDIPRTGCTLRAILFADINFGDQRPVPENILKKVDEMRERYWSKINKHAAALEYQSLSPNKFNEYYKFTFVRNPWDRMVSFYRYRQRKYGAKNFTWYILGNKFHDLDIQQLDYISDKQGKILVDFIGRFENLYQDFNELGEIIRFSRRLTYLPDRLSAPYGIYYNKITK